MSYDADAERAEAERLQRQIRYTIDQIEKLNNENIELENQLNTSISNVAALIQKCRQLDTLIVDDMSTLSVEVADVDISTKHILEALNELMVQYFAFKKISSASKYLTQYTEEYYKRFSYYQDLRRISLGYVIGLDSNIISSEVMRKKVEVAYLQNTEYWLAYCIAAVMLWASNEQEAAKRAIHKALNMQFFNSSLFFLLINLRFDRIDAAKKWYINYLERVDENNLGEEWKYLLQAYLFGAFGSDEKFQSLVSSRFREMLSRIEATSVDYAKRFTKKAIQHAELYLHQTEHEYVLLKRTCAEYDDLKGLLTSAEKNSLISAYYVSLLDAEISENLDLPQRIENVFYSLINGYEEEELKVIKKMEYNECVIAAGGDLAAAQANFNSKHIERNGKNLGDLLIEWAFADDMSQTDVSVKRFSISYMKEAISAGYQAFAKKYRENEREKYLFIIDDWQMECSEDDYLIAQKSLQEHFKKFRFRHTMNDKFVLGYSCVCLLAMILLSLLFVKFTPVLMTVGILIGLAGSFLLWRRLVDVKKILLEKCRSDSALIKSSLEELRQWRQTYKQADSQNDDIIAALEKY